MGEMLASFMTSILTDCNRSCGLSPHGRLRFTYLFSFRVDAISIINFFSLLFSLSLFFYVDLSKDIKELLSLEELKVVIITRESFP